mmetsp:Transcript_23597/g.51782  ORF Transcript_23597/g.51782 Transcript_23597/m.51782 type:complete len:205 (-) Transcript_23597:2899-3513(-)
MRVSFLGSYTAGHASAMMTAHREVVASRLRKRPSMAMVLTPMISSRNLADATTSHLSRNRAMASASCSTRPDRLAGLTSTRRPRTSRKPSITLTTLTATPCAGTAGCASSAAMALKVDSSSVGTSWGNSCSITSASADAAMASCAASGGKAREGAGAATPAPAGGAGVDRLTSTAWVTVPMVRCSDSWIIALRGVRAAAAPSSR